MNKKYKLVLKVPQTPKSAYDHGRFISGLIAHQIMHFHELEKSLLKRGQKLTDISKIKTELHASKYLKKMTARLHPQGGEQPQNAVKSKKARSAPKRKPKTKAKIGRRNRK